MADQQPLSCGLAGSCKSARRASASPAASEADTLGTPRPSLPPDIVRLIDSLVRVMEREAWLRGMNGGDLASA